MFIHNFERTFSVRVVCLSLHSAAAGTSDTNPEHWAFSLTAWGWSSVELINMSRWNVLFLINDVQALVRTLGNVYKILKVRSRESEKIKSIKTEILSHWPKASAENKPLIVVFVFCYDHHEVTVKCMYVHDLYSWYLQKTLVWFVLIQSLPQARSVSGTWRGCIIERPWEPSSFLTSPDHRRSRRVIKWKEDLDAKLSLSNDNHVAAVLLANKCDQGRDVLTNNGIKWSSSARRTASWDALKLQPR